MNILNTLLALAPIITVFLLLVVFKLSAKISMAIAYVVTALLAVFFWQAAPAVVLEAASKHAHPGSPQRGARGVAHVARITLAFKLEFNRLVAVDPLTANGGQSHQASPG